MRRVFAVLCVLPLSACGWWDGAFAPYQIGAPNYGQYYGQSAQNTRGPGFYDRRRATGQLAIEGGVGASVIAGGTLIDEGRSRTPLPSGNARTMTDSFDDGTRVHVTASYPRRASDRYFTATAYRTQYDGKTANFSRVNGGPVSGRLSDYTAHGVEFGLRQYAPRALSFAHPFVEGRIGGAYVDGISLETPLRTTPLFESGWVPAASATVGIEAPAFNRFTVGLETGVTYQGRLGAVERTVDGSARNTVGQDIIGGARRSGSLISVPVTLRGRYKF